MGMAFKLSDAEHPAGQVVEPEEVGAVRPANLVDPGVERQMTSNRAEVSNLISGTRQEPDNVIPLSNETQNTNPVEGQPRSRLVRESDVTGAVIALVRRFLDSEQAVFKIRELLDRIADETTESAYDQIAELHGMIQRLAEDFDRSFNLNLPAGVFRVAAATTARDLREIERTRRERAEAYKRKVEEAAALERKRALGIVP